MTEKAKDGQLNAIYDSLNFLGTTCWKVNTRILDIMVGIFNDKGDAKLEIFGPDFPPLPRIKTRFAEFNYLLFLEVLLFLILWM